LRIVDSRPLADEARMTHTGDNASICFGA
jgi:hypothetical protein